ncbi:methyl-accepting chemotaxis protein [Pectinatus frisingensis]|uniref:methyl-accepting chemotaxis protein n=1 Tax=Pectinatus frisingensis TaxID=865 RepID=UPI0018C85DA5|nr:methyl-accepting chemotaxis protein [Pectinatus frisingensis]
MALNSVRKKFLAILLPLFIISFVVIAGLIYYMADKMLNESNERIAKNISQQVSSSIEAEVSKTLLPLKAGSHNAIFYEPGNETAKLQALAEIKSDDSSVAETFYVDLNGNALRGDGTYLKRGDREYFKKAVETKKPYIAEPFMGSTTQKLMTMVVQPIMVNNELRGVLMGSVNIEELAKNIDKFKLSTSGYTYITDGRGMVIGFAQKPELEGKLNVAGEGSSAGNGEKVDDVFARTFKNAMEMNAQKQVYFNDTDGKKFYAIITPFELAGNTWTVVTAAPVKEINAPVYTLLKSIAGIVAVILVMVVLFIFRFSKNISTALSILLDECSQINKGIISDTKCAMKRNDEIGKLAEGFSNMKQTLRNLVKMIQVEAEQVSASSEELTASSDQYSKIAEQTAESVNEIAQGSETQSTSAHKISDMSSGLAAGAVSIAKKTKNIADNAVTAKNSINNNSIVMTKVVAQMNDIAQNTEQIETSIQKLDSSSQKIGDILKLIISISEETNLLALNAAIEAARAGEAGKGFAVVAEQVRKLAEGTATSTQQITQLIEDNQADIKVVVEASHSGGISVNSGIDAVKSANTVFDTTVKSIDSLAQEILEVAGYIENMPDKTDVMFKASVDINNISEQSAQETQSVAAAIEEQSASVKEIAAASHNLSQLACDLQEKVQNFKI